MLALFGVLFFEVLVGLLLAIIIAIGLVIWRLSNERGCLLGRTPDGRFKDISLNPEAREVDGVKIVRLNAGLFYANAPVIKTRLLGLIREEPRPLMLIVDMEVQTHGLDISSARALEKAIMEAEERGVEVVFVDVHTLMMRDLEKQGLVERIGKDHFKDTIEEALLGVEKGA